MNIIEFNGYRLDNRKEFMQLATPGLIKRVEEQPGDYVLWDPNNDDNGFLIAGFDPVELEQEFINHFGDYLVQLEETHCNQKQKYPQRLSLKLIKGYKSQ